MKVLTLLISILSISFSVNAQQNSRILVGSTDSLYSETLNETRRFSVFVPDNMGEPTNGYPVLYLLDGDNFFQTTVGLITHLNSCGFCPQMIIVGILNTNRDRDFTPTHYEDPHNISETKNSGGGEQFLTFIEKELIPRIESTYKTLPYRMFIGHSTGGLTVVNALIKHRDMFNSYVAIDPSMSWHNQKLLKESKMILANTSFEGKSLFLAIANTMERNMDTTKVKNDSSFSSFHIRSILTLGGYLASNTQNQLRFKQKYYEDENHPSIPLIAEYDAFKYLFDFYKFNYYISDVTESCDPAMALDLRLDAHYKKASRMLGYTVTPPEELTDQLAFGALHFGNKTLAERLLAMNVLSYPKNFSVYDTLGDFYSATGDKIKAIAAYNQALLIKDSEEIREKVKAIR